MFDLTGQVAVITGSSRGIGRATAQCMSRAGAKVVVSSRKPAACQAVVDAITAEGGEAIVVPCNVSEKEQLQNLIDQTAVSYTHLRAHETVLELVCRLLLEKKKHKKATANEPTASIT